MRSTREGRGGMKKVAEFIQDSRAPRSFEKFRGLPEYSETFSLSLSASRTNQSIDTANHYIARTSTPEAGTTNGEELTSRDARSVERHVSLPTKKLEQCEPEQPLSPPRAFASRTRVDCDRSQSARRSAARLVPRPSLLACRPPNGSTSCSSSSTPMRSTCRPIRRAR